MRGALHLGIAAVAAVLLRPGPTLAEEVRMTDLITTARGDLRITFLGHGTLMFEHDGRVVHVDPWAEQADYGKLPKADLVLVTHEHFDHLDPAAVAKVTKEGTVVAASAGAAAKLPGAVVLRNGEAKTLAGIPVTAVPAYNVRHMRSPGNPFHPKGVGNGYVIDFAGTRVYVAGDTEDIPEMRALRAIDVAFLPMNLPYTMTPEMVAAAATAFRPGLLYPYHFGDTDTGRLVELLRGSGIEVRVREMR